MEEIKNADLRQMLSELSGRLCQIYGKRLKSIILYGSTARGTQTNDSDIDIMILIEGDREFLREFSDALCDISSDMALKYLRVFSIIDVGYEEFSAWNKVLPFYKKISEEGIVVYAA